ncbi:hypothetical protein EPN52_04700 [bacterium]|nr:MAG: hypothetical protein EPN52_04700 [bacterium]
MNKNMRAFVAAALFVGLAIPAAASAQQLPARQLAAANFGTRPSICDSTAASRQSDQVPARYIWMAGP